MSATPRLKLALAQLNLLVGDVGGNATRVLEALAHARDRFPGNSGESTIGNQ